MEEQGKPEGFLVIPPQGVEGLCAHPSEEADVNGAANGELLGWQDTHGARLEPSKVFGLF